MARIKWRRYRGWCLSAFEGLWNTCDPHHKYWLIYFILRFFFYSFHFTVKKKKKKKFLQDFFWCCLVLPYFYCRIACPVGLNCDQMEEVEQYSEYSVERNPRAYMSMRDYRNLLWQNQQPLGRNSNPSRSMRDYRD